MTPLKIRFSAKEIAGLLALISFAAVNALLQPELIGAAVAKPRPARLASLSPLAQFGAPAPSPLQAGEQIRSTPSITDPAAALKDALCKNAACRTRPNTPTASWERLPVPAIETVVEER